MSLSLALPDLPNHVLLAAALAFLLAYTVFGATGFGSSIISVPALAHLLPLTFVVPLVTSVDAFAATMNAVRLRRVIAWREVIRLLPAQLAGMTLGATLLLNLPREPALLALGMFAAGYGSYVLAGPRRLARAPDWLVWPIGLVGGVFSALFGTGGPIYIVYLAARVDDKSVLRATSVIVVTVAVWSRLLLFVATGLLLDPTLLALAALLLPVMLAGLWLGNRLHHALSRGGVLRLIAVLLIGNGAALVLRAVEAMRA